MKLSTALLALTLAASADAKKPKGCRKIKQNKGETM